MTTSAVAAEKPADIQSIHSHHSLVEDAKKNETVQSSEDKTVESSENAKPSCCREALVSLSGKVYSFIRDKINNLNDQSGCVSKAFWKTAGAVTLIFNSIGGLVEGLLKKILSAVTWLLTKCKILSDQPAKADERLSIHADILAGGGSRSLKAALASIKGVLSICSANASNPLAGLDDAPAKADDNKTEEAEKTDNKEEATAKTADSTEPTETAKEESDKKSQESRKEDS